MGRCGCDPIDVAGCQCSVEDSDCIVWSGSGTNANPFLAELNVDTDADNILVCGPQGAGAFLPLTLGNPPRIHVYRQNDTLIPDNELSTISFTNERFDSNTFWALGDPTKIYFLTEGCYHVGFEVSWGAGVVSPRGLLRHSGGGVICSESYEAATGSGDVTRQNGSKIWEFEAGDFMTMEVFHQTGASEYINDSGTPPATAWAFYVGPLDA